MNASPSIRLFWASGVDEEARYLFSYYLKIPHRIRLCAVTVYQNKLLLLIFWSPSYRSIVYITSTSIQRRRLRRTL